jgi:hypothetical protein
LTLQNVIIINRYPDDSPSFHIFRVFFKIFLSSQASLSSKKSKKSKKNTKELKATNRGAFAYIVTRFSWQRGMFLICSHRGTMDVKCGAIEKKDLE